MQEEDDIVKFDKSPFSPKQLVDEEEESLKPRSKSHGS